MEKCHQTKKQAKIDFMKKAKTFLARMFKNAEVKKLDFES
jgi:hypothetical protein